VIWLASPSQSRRSSLAHGALKIAGRSRYPDMPLEAEAVNSALHHPPFAHHRLNLLPPAEENQRPAPRSSRVFNAIDVERT
jgi:hypothetical protein